MQELIAALIEATRTYLLAQDVYWRAKEAEQAAGAQATAARIEMETLQRKLRSEIQVAAGGDPISEP